MKPGDVIDPADSLHTDVLEVPQQTNQPDVDISTETNGLSWEASEYSAQSKSGLWYITALLATGVVAAGYYLLARDILAAIVIILSGFAFMVYAAKKPKTITYNIDGDILKVGEREHNFDDFKSFSVHEDEHGASVLLVPNKRFLPVMTISLDPQSATDAIELISTYLPHEQRSADFVDKLSKKIRY